MFAHLLSVTHAIAGHLPDFPMTPPTSPPGGIVSDPKAVAPPGLQATVSTVLGFVKWASITAVLGLLLSAGVVALAADHGRGGGLSSEMKSLVGRAVVALIIIGSGAQVVNFLVA